MVGRKIIRGEAKNQGGPQESGQPVFDQFEGH
jgi:hypothetical protein